MIKGDSMDFKNLLFKKEGHIGILSINRPDALNALNSQVLDELDSAMDILKEDGEIHVIILTGEGRAFVAGADIKEMKDMDMFKAREFADKGESVFRK